jgi:hypothetical protein
MGTLVALIPRSAAAGPWNIEPKVGITGEYTSNPLLRAGQEDVAEEHVAALVDFPLRYDTDSVELTLQPSGRVSNSAGYSSLASNYAHFTGAAQFSNELGATVLRASAARDSSLYYSGTEVSGIGVRRDTASGGADWSRAVNERSQFQLDAGWTQVRYDQPPSLQGFLTDYRYYSASPAISRAMDERDSLNLLGSVGLYQSLDGITETKPANLQLGWTRALTEIWKLNASVGYSRSTNSEKTLFFGTLSSTQSGAVYSVVLTRQSERVGVSASASRSLTPTGFAFLSTQDNAHVDIGYTLSERWDFGLSGIYQKAVSPVQSLELGLRSGRETTVRYLSGSINADWHWTEQWVVTLSATRITDQYATAVIGPNPLISAGSTVLSVQFTRRFPRTEL